jgi:hypothetical protein
LYEPGQAEAQKIKPQRNTKAQKPWCSFVPFVVKKSLHKKQGFTRKVLIYPPYIGEVHRGERKVDLGKLPPIGLAHHHRREAQRPDECLAAAQFVDGVRAAAQDVVQFFSAGSGELAMKLLMKFR